MDLAECDNLLKTPLFGAFVGVPMFLFGTSLGVARLTVLVFLTIILTFLSRKRLFSQLLIIAIPVLFFKYQVFQFSHFSLGEIPATVSILLGIYFLYLTYKPSYKEKDYIKLSLLAATFISLAWYFKIQFIYILALGPAIAIERAFFAKNLNRRIIWLNGLVIAATTIFFLVLYTAVWYLPFKDTYDYMMAHQSGTFTLGPKTWEYIRFNTTYFMLSNGNQAFFITFLVCFAIGIILLFRNTSSHFTIVFKTTLVWLLLELHKLTMVYLPTRYQVSMFIAMGMIISIVLLELFHQAEMGRKRWIVISLRTFLISWVIFLFIFNVNGYKNSYENRSYHIREANQYLSKTLDRDDVVIGAWAPSFTWDAKCRAIPVWGGFLNDNDPLERFQPRIVVSEPDEQDSEQAYVKQGIDLAAASDSVRTFHIGSWEVSINWLK
jgi:hypothetical protein